MFLPPVRLGAPDRLTSLGGPAAVLCLAIAAGGCSGLLGIEEFSDRDARSTGGAGGSVGGAGGSTGGAGGSTGGAGGSTGGAGGSTGGAGGSTGGAGGSLPTLLVFVTAAVESNGVLGSLEDADARCASAAQMGVLTQGHSSWQAWLSNNVDPDALSAGDRFLEVDARWARPDGPVVFESYFELFDGSGPEHAINVDQHGNVIALPANLAVWTGTTQNGHAAEHNCSNWSTGISTMRGTVGNCSSSDGEWTDDGTDFWCNQPARIYCFEMPPEG